MSADFQQLIQNLKKDLKSLPSIEECAPEKAVSIMTKEDDVLLPMEKKKSFFRYHHHQQWAEYFMRHIFLSVEFFFFFLILLAMLKPEFLYIKEKKKETRHEVVLTRFSYINLFCYSVFFTACIHGMIHLQQYLVIYIC